MGIKMSKYDFTGITETLKQFNRALDLSGITRISNYINEIQSSINVNMKPIIELSEKWNKTQEDMLGGLKPALESISYFSKKVSETMNNLPQIQSNSHPDLYEAFEKYDEAAAPCLYEEPEPVVLSNIKTLCIDNIATKQDILEIKVEVNRLHKTMTVNQRINNMNENEYSDEAEYIYTLLVKHYKNNSVNNHSTMVDVSEFESDLGEEAFELGLQELISRRYIANYESYIDGSYRIDLALRCEKSFKEQMETLSSDTNSMVDNPPYVKFLYDNGYILENMSVVKSINEVACAIHDNFPKISVTKQLLSQFKNKDKKYSDKALQEAVTQAYTK